MRKKSKRLIALLVSLLMVISLMPTTGLTVEAAAKPKLAKKSVSIVIGGTSKIKVKNAPKGAKITYKSAKKSIATVSKQGKVKGIKSGTTKITVSVKKNSKTTKLTYKVTVKKPKLSKSKLSLKVGKTYNLSVKNKPKKAKYTWTSSNSRVATVNKSGKVTAKTKGTATIKAKVRTAKKTYSLSCKVTVKSTSDNSNDVKQTYTVTFNSNGGSAVASQTVKKNGKAIQPVNPTRDGYTFDGWYTAASGGQKFDFNMPITANIILYAHWTENDTGEISFTMPNPENIVINENDSEIYYVNNQILLTVKDETDISYVENLIKPYDGTIVGCVEITGDYQIELSSAMTYTELEDIVNALMSDESVESASVHDLYQTEMSVVPNDAKWNGEEWSADYPEGFNWGVEAIDALGAWAYYNQMVTVNVGIIDSMFDNKHEDLKFVQIWNNPSSVTTNDKNTYFNNSHGTHVAGTMSALYDNNIGIAGVAPKVNLYGYSMLGEASDSVILDENKSLSGYMQWKYALAKLITANCKVINVSMGLSTPSESTSREAGAVYGEFLKKLLDKNYDFVIVQAAGNSSDVAYNTGIFAGIEIESIKSRIIIVGAIGTNGSHKDGLFGWFGDRVFDGYYYADFSNYGNRVDIVAPGVNIYSTVPGNKYENQHSFGFLGIGGRGTWDGTSMAAPHVSGIVAMCYAINPSLTGNQIKNIIINSSEVSVTDNNNGHEPSLNYPIANANNAVELALSTEGVADSPVNPSTGIVMGNIKGYTDEHDSITLEDVSVSAYKTSSYDGNLMDYVSSVKTDSDGNYELILESGCYYLNIYKEGYLPFAILNVVVDNDETTFLDNVILIKDSGAEVSNIMNGYIRNALTGEAISDVKIQLRLGWNNQTGDLATRVNSDEYATTTTDEEGYYTLEVLEGCYTAELKKDGYITSFVNVICSNTNAEQNGVMTPVLSDDEYRIVLTWSDTPRDLDSHISGPLLNGERFHVYYKNMGAIDDSNIVAILDLDDTTSYGPETITLKKTLNGVYRYSVHDYTNAGSSNSTALSMSGAKVVLYRGNALIATYNVPINVGGTVWNVFEIDGDVINTLNTMEYISDEDEVSVIN